MKTEDLPASEVLHTMDRATFSDMALTIIGEFPNQIVSCSGNMDYVIDDALAKVGSLLKASRVYVMLNEKEGKYLRNTHEWVDQKIGPTMFSWPLYDYEYDIPSLKDIISAYEIYFGHSREMPPDFYRVLSKQGVVSFILSPICRDNCKIGLVGMDFCEGEQHFNDKHTVILRSLAGIVNLALERKQYLVMRSKLYSIRNCVADLEPVSIEETHKEDTGLTRPNKPTTLLDAERRIIIETLELYNGNKLKTAKHLGLTWPSLDRRCKKLGIEVRRK